MSTTIIRLLRVDFDNLENQSGDALSTTLVKTFMDDPAADGMTAYGKMQTWLQTYTALDGLYLGWNMQVYPQFKVEEERVE